VPHFQLSRVERIMVTRARFAHRAASITRFAAEYIQVWTSAHLRSVGAAISRREGIYDLLNSQPTGNQIAKMAT